MAGKAKPASVMVRGGRRRIEQVEHRPQMVGRAGMVGPA
jgi:hypothetical protein